MLNRQLLSCLYLVAVDIGPQAWFDRARDIAFAVDWRLYVRYNSVVDMLTRNWTILGMLLGERHKYLRRSRTRPQ